jgi:hypothetical protein
MAFFRYGFLNLTLRVNNLMLITKIRNILMKRNSGSVFFNKDLIGEERPDPNPGTRYFLNSVFHLPAAWSP